jgi:hypothetical protein
VLQALLERAGAQRASGREARRTSLFAAQVPAPLLPCRPAPLPPALLLAS